MSLSRSIGTSHVSFQPSRRMMMIVTHQIAIQPQRNMSLLQKRRRLYQYSGNKKAIKAKEKVIIIKEKVLHI